MKLAFIFIVLFFFLSLRFFFFYHNKPHFKDGQYASFETTLFSEPQFFSRYQSVSAYVNGRDKILIVTALYPEFHYGDRIKISGVVKFLASRIRHQRNKAISKERSIVMYFPKTELVKRDKNLLLAITAFVRQKMTSLFNKTFSPTYSSFLLGIVFGIREPMPKDFSQKLRVVGITHVIAASGMNVTMVAGFLSAVFGFFLKRQLAVMLSIVGIIFYAVLAGLEPSILRASIMGGLAFCAQILGRQRLAWFGLLVACFVILFLSPTTLFDIGFQLSFLATAGLLYIRPILERGMIKKIMINSVVGEGIITTISAQLATLPILLVHFGNYSGWSMVVNGLVLWVIATLMVVGGMGGLVGIIIPSLGQLILYLSLPLLIYVERIVNMFAGLGGVVRIDWLPWQFIVGYYSLILALVVFFKKRVEKS